MKKYIPILLGIFLLVMTLGVVSASVMSVSAPTSALPSSSFQVTYTASGTPSKWGAIISEALSGGCTFSGGATSYKAGFLSTEGNTKTVTINTPASGTCTLTGYYQFSEDSSRTDFPAKSITISSTCQPSCSGKICGDNGCGGSCGTCSSGLVCSSGQCVEEGEELPWYNKVAFTIGDFEVKVWMLLAIAGIIILMIFLKK